MKTRYVWTWVLAAAALLTGCTNEEDLVVKNPSGIHTYTATVTASRGDVEGISSEDAETRALFVGGNTNRYANIWDAGDRVLVYKGSTKVGTLEPSEVYYGTKDATLSGSLTGEFNVGDEVTLYLTSKNDLSRDYSKQTGTIYGLSSKVSYQTQTVHVAAINGENITLTSANMNHQQAYLRFVLQDETTGKRLHPRRLVVTHIKSDERPYRMVGQVTADGKIYYAANGITATPPEENGEYPGELFVAIQNEGFNASSLTHQKVNYKLTAVADGQAYVGPTTELYAAPKIGNLSRVIRSMTPVTPTVDLAPQMTLSPGKSKTRKVLSLSADGVPIIFEDYTVTYSSSDPSIVSVDAATGKVTAAVDAPIGSTATITASVAPYNITGSYTVTIKKLEIHAVDLGLNVKWADRNVGAEIDTEVGTYFAWGETDGWTSPEDYSKNTFSWETYKFFGGYDSDDNPTLTKYVYSAQPQYAAGGNPDGVYMLAAEDDAAYVNISTRWRTPSFAQMSELLNTYGNSSYRWTYYDGVNAQYNGSSTPGWEVEYLVNGNHIFFPLTGHLVNTVNKAPNLTYGWYSLIGLSSYSGSLYRNGFTLNVTRLSQYPRLRFWGYPVRAIYYDSPTN